VVADSAPRTNPAASASAKGMPSRRPPNSFGPTRAAEAAGFVAFGRVVAGGGSALAAGGGSAMVVAGVVPGVVPGGAAGAGEPVHPASNNPASMIGTNLEIVLVRIHVGPVRTGRCA
jgi:hypothetical protein